MLSLPTELSVQNGTFLPQIEEARRSDVEHEQSGGFWYNTRPRSARGTKHGGGPTQAMLPSAKYVEIRRLLEDQTSPDP